jgi:hypothetical protein
MLSPSVFKFNAIIGLNLKIAGDLMEFPAKMCYSVDRLSRQVNPRGSELGSLRGESTELVEVLPKSSRCRKVQTDKP